MAGEIYRKPIMFAIVAAVVILIGTIATVFFPMFTEGMHPKLENLKPYTALQLAGKDIYQREGCNNCHTQTVRPLKTEVMRYGDYSKAGEFTYDRPFLWGSKRTGPDLARIGGKYPDAWHHNHFENPQSFFKESNMPKYGWLKDSRLDPVDMEVHMKVNGFPYTKEEIADLSSKTELDALVAYMQVIGTAVKRAAPAAPGKASSDHEVENPFKNDPKAAALGKDIYDQNCAMCHGTQGEGGIGPSLTDDMFLYIKGDLPDDDYYEVIHNGTEQGKVEEGRTMKGGMPPYGGQLDKNRIWQVISYIRSLQKK
ncbi:MAG: cbb3-type cytochrome c oxidase subunit II [Nitrospirae bacterium]|nr:cbb3-type cytochrome c oxidase subunit II [Nitrospirota bacterium]